MKPIALTFDDGPDPATTPRLLAALAAADAKATFMLWGERVAAHPQLVRQVVSAGHAVGNHTHSHPNLEGLTAAQVVAELSRADRAIEAASGVTPSFFRPPYGVVNAHVLAAANRPAVTWRVDSEDWRTHDGERTYSRVLALVQPGDIVLLHDGLISTAEILPRLLCALTEAGYTMVTVPELLAAPLQAQTVYPASGIAVKM